MIPSLVCNEASAIRVAFNLEASWETEIAQNFEKRTMSKDGFDIGEFGIIFCLISGNVINVRQLQQFLVKYRLIFFSLFTIPKNREILNRTL